MFISKSLKRTNVLCAVLRTKGTQAFSDPNPFSDDNGEGLNLTPRYDRMVSGLWLAWRRCAWTWRGGAARAGI
ncbi:hypothetical protein ES332_D12G097600v1 [Gossypium tomentosum]|uniref:Uncharacterized protein n=1 Tax=Gossypium tomentosum TaxID=34277 RepID=A0A5D2I823_GOSTO|nr:hypothetical protein ES332_D12G097600v1 [Gossypium tomentosum]